MTTNNGCLSGLLVGLAAASVPVAAPAQPLKSVQWQNRPLLIFAPSQSDAMLAKQRAIVRRARSGFLERDMIVVEIVGGSIQTTVGRSPSTTASAIRRHYGVGNGSFRVMLVGKDGGRKLSSRHVVSSGQLFGLIDSMPMRRDEMRRRN